jgi:hypothetical protein
MQSENENGTDYVEQRDEFTPIWGCDETWMRAPPTPNGFRKKSKKRGCNFTKSKKRK